MRVFASIIIISFVVALLASPAISIDFDYVHCDYLEIVDGYECSDWNIWYAPGHEITQQMRDYYEGFLGLNYIIPQTWPETFTVSNMSP